MGRSIQEYINEIIRLKVPEHEGSILEFLGTLDTPNQKQYLSFVLSQSHFIDSMYSVLGSISHRDFYESCGYHYNGPNGNIVPKIGKDGKVFYEEIDSYEKMDKPCHEIIESLQHGDKRIWTQFVQYIERIYDPDKIDTQRNHKNEMLKENMQMDFFRIKNDRYNNEKLIQQLEKMDEYPVVIPEKGIIAKLKGYFAKRKFDNERKKLKSQVQDDEVYEKRAIELIEKYMNNPDVPAITKKQLEFAEELIKAGLPPEVFTDVLTGLTYSYESSAAANRYIFEMQKHLQASAKIAQEMYSPEIIYANSLQDMTKGIRRLLASHEISEHAPLTTEYRTNPLGNRLNAKEDISNILKGKNLSQDEIITKMEELDVEFEEAQKERDPEEYIRRCTQISMKFISIHPFDDGNGRTSRILLQAMLARRGIILPSTINNYFERQQGTAYTDMEDRCLRSENYTEMENYIIERAKSYNGGEIELIDEPLILPNERSTQTIERNSRS